MATLFDLPLERITNQEISAFLAGRIPEAERHEYKSRWDTDKVGATICGFANTSGGILLVGVTDSKGNPPYSATGIPRGERTPLEDQAHSISSAMTPPVRIETTSVDVEGGKVVALVRVAPSMARPHAYRDRVYMRVGDATKVAPLTVVEQLFHQRYTIRDGETLLAQLKGDAVHHALTYRTVLIADSYAESPLFLDMEADALLATLGQAALGGTSQLSTRPRAVHLDRADVPLGNDYLEVDERLSLVRFRNWLGDPNHDGNFVVSETMQMTASLLALSLRARERFQRSLLVDMRFDQGLASGVPLADTHPWNHFLGLTGTETAPGGPPIGEEYSVDLASEQQCLSVIAAIANLSVRACGLSAPRSFFDTVAQQVWEKALSAIGGAELAAGWMNR